jgi:Fic family protein
VLSSQIEGTQSSIADLLLHENQALPGVVLEDVQEVSNYIGALSYGIDRLSTLPLSLRLIRESHERLVHGTRGDKKAPGEFRRSQNWIGGSKPSDAMFVPPPPHELQDILSAFEKFLHSTEYPVLIKVGLAHAQFETIHPFTDGNGRTGRMLIAMYIHHLGLLEEPVLYLSSYFKKYQKLYYQKLQGYHDEDTDIDGWLEFFLEGVAEIANSGIETCTKITALRDRDFAKMQKLGKKSAASTLEIVRKLFGQPIVGVAEIMRWTGFTAPGAYNVIKRLEKLKILEPLGDDNYGQKYVYADYYEIFDDSFKQARLKK